MFAFLLQALHRIAEVPTGIQRSPINEVASRTKLLLCNHFLRDKMKTSSHELTGVLVIVLSVESGFEPPYGQLAASTLLIPAIVKIRANLSSHC